MVVPHTLGPCAYPLDLFINYRNNYYTQQYIYIYLCFKCKRLCVCVFVGGRLLADG